MALNVYHCRGIDARAIHHDGNIAIRPSAFAAYDGYGLSGFDALPHFDQILNIVGIHRLKPVVVTHHNHIAIVGMMSGETHHAIEHGFYGISLLGFNGEEEVGFLFSLAHRQRKRVVTGTDCAKFNSEGIALVKQSGSGNAYLLLLGRRKLVAGRCKSRYRSKERNAYKKKM